MSIIAKLEAEGAAFIELALEVSKITGMPVERVMAQAEERAHNANDARSEVDRSLPAVTRYDMLIMMKEQATTKANGKA